MDLILYLIFILAYFILFGFGFFLIRRKATIPGIILVLVTLGLIIDNAILASGALIGD
ncbi:hypothetical protein [Bacillus sp. V2I10]|uniref:hypothetical protein n=1 Tax=Bacillus sp. V2I10 TaxID=3042276 RepID=UPI0027810DD5|nr:hypothetical protein [Bacillus sp. V2I10]MDQ0859205.1 multisubunit Na+/H+ antiporter MnhC subunit [Bacillus sp. V2I10]